MTSLAALVVLLLVDSGVLVVLVGRVRSMVAPIEYGLWLPR